ncbi:MAG TPA: flagellar basal body L-ring protein FlgH [Candidatus Angelobacter sp.]|jgi:flagellar L-ring protein precursor FlgH|nr:flagellar basal body L-ring protein FlgH [Candidatus Angelobacter sp.]
MIKKFVICALLLGSIAWGKNKKVPPPPPALFIPTDAPELHTVGSLWSDQGILSDMSKDYKAHRVNDIVMIRILEKTDASQTGQVKTSRAFAANAAVTQLGGRLSTANNLQQLLNANSSNSLNGQGASTSDTTMTTVLAGRVVQVLANGNMVIEASRDVDINNERTTAIVRGLIRPGDVAADNSVLSSSVSDLHLELKGKGVVTDSVRPPNKIVRLVLKVLGF